MNKRRECDLETFLKDVKTHELTILRDEGIYRHLQLQKANHSWDQRYQIVTFPGTLVFTGDMGTYVFSRIPDMFQFFRRHRDRPIEINPHYWREKCDAADQMSSGDGIKEWDLEAFKEYIRGRLDEAEATSAVRAEVEKRVFSEAQDGEHYAFAGLDWYRRHGTDGERIFGCIESYDPTVYTYRYLWACFAIVWAIDKYDAAIAQRATLTGQSSVA